MNRYKKLIINSFLSIIVIMLLLCNPLIANSQEETSNIATITGIYPQNPTNSQILVINGHNFGLSGVVKFSGMLDAEIIKWSDTTILCIVPEAAVDGAMYVQSDQNGTSSDLDIVLNEEVAPIEEIDPVHGVRYYKLLSSGERRLVAEIIDSTVVHYVGYPNKGYGTIKEALMYAEAGHAIQLAALGQSAAYQENELLISKSIELRGDPSASWEEVVIDGASFFISSEEARYLNDMNLPVPSARFARVKNGSSGTTKLVVENITFKNFDILHGGVNGHGAVFLASSNAESLTLRNVAFEQNSAVRGGAIAGAFTRIGIEGCLFKDNRGAGAAIDISGGSLGITDTGFIDNMYDATSRITYAAGAIDLRDGSDLMIDNSLFLNNRSYCASAITIRESASHKPIVEIANCTFTKNRTHSEAIGGIIWIERSERSSSRHIAPEIRLGECIMYDNIGKDIDFNPYVVGYAEISLANTVLRGPVGLPQRGCVDVSYNNVKYEDPLFVDTENGDYRIYPDSPAQTPEDPVTQTPAIPWGSEGFFEGICGLAAEGTASTEVILTWDECRFSQIGFEVEYTDGDDIVTDEFLQKGATERLIAGLTPEVEYTFKIRAILQTGERTEWSREVTIATLSAPYLDSAISNDNGDAVLNWHHNTLLSTHTIIYRSHDRGMTFEELETIENALGNEYIDRAILPMRTYTYAIVSKNSNAISDRSNSIDIGDFFSAPELITVTPDSSSSPQTIVLTWNSNSANRENGVEVYYSYQTTGSWSSWSRIIELPAGSTNYTWSNASANTNYKFKVRTAFGDDIYSDFSNEIEAPLLKDINNLTATVVSLNSIRLNWSDQLFEDGYRIERSSDGVNWGAPVTVNSDVIEYLDEDSIQRDTTYYYRVRAYTDKGDLAADSNIENARTETPAPTNLAVTIDSVNQQASFSWEYPTSATNQGFKIGYKRSGTSSWYPINIDKSGDRTAVESIPQASRNYEHDFKICAVFDGEIESGDSNVVRAPLLNLPINNLRAAPDGSGGIDLTWTDNNSYKDGYEAYRSTALDGTYTRIGDTASQEDQSSFNDSKAEPNQTYYYKVRAFKGTDHAAWSDPASTRTELPMPTNLTVADQVTAPTNIFVKNHDNDYISWEYADNLPRGERRSYIYKVDQDNNWSDPIEESKLSIKELSQDLDLTPGSHVLYIKAIDADGNELDGIGEKEFQVK